MKTRDVFHAALLCSSCITVVLSAGLFVAYSQEKTDTIAGVVVAIESDSQGKPTTIAIAVESVDGYDSYIIIPNTKGRELLRQIYSTVKVSGVVEQKGDEKWIAIQSWELQAVPGGEEEEEEWEPLDDDIGYSDEEE